MEVEGGKEILVFTYNPGDSGWGPKCNRVVAKHAHKQRTSVCFLRWFRWSCFSCQYHFCRQNFSWLAWLSDSMFTFCRQYCQFYHRFGGFLEVKSLKQLATLVPVGSHVVLSCVLAVGLWRTDFITPVRRVIPLLSFYIEKTHPPKRISRTGWPGNSPWWGKSPNMWWKKKKKDCVDRLVTPPPRQGDFSCPRSPTSMWTGP